MTATIIRERVRPAKPRTPKNIFHNVDNISTFEKNVKINDDFFNNVDNKNVNYNNTTRIDRQAADLIIQTDILLSRKPNAKKVLSYIIGKYNKNLTKYGKPYADCTLAHIAKQTKLTKCQVRYALKFLDQYVKKSIDPNDKRLLNFTLDSIFFNTNLTRISHEISTTLARSTPPKPPTEKLSQPFPISPKDSFSLRDSIINNNNNIHNTSISKMQKTCQKDVVVTFSDKLLEMLKELKITPEHALHYQREYQVSKELLDDCIRHIYKYIMIDKQPVTNSIEAFFRWLLKNHEKVNFSKTVDYFSEKGFSRRQAESEKTKVTGETHEKVEEFRRNHPEEYDIMVFDIAKKKGLDLDDEMDSLQFSRELENPTNRANFEKAIAKRLDNTAREKIENYEPRLEKLLEDTFDFGEGMTQIGRVF